jgi:3-mercaptopyruvate sulfurtransferase SseA
MGLENVAHVEGGFEAWKKAGGPVAEKAHKAPQTHQADPAKKSDPA